MQNTLCFGCKNYVGDLSCLAFVQRIPSEILLAENGHTKPLAGQGNDVVYEPKNGEWKEVKMDWRGVKRVPAGQQGGGQWAGNEAITLYHGSKFKFDQFDSSMIGQGEGAGLWGDGFYLTDSPEIAQFYAQHVAKKDFIVGYRPTGIFGTDEPIFHSKAEELALANQHINEFVVQGKILDAATFIIDDGLKEKIIDSFVKHNPGWGTSGRQVAENSFDYLKNHKEKIANYRGELDYIIGQVANGNKDVTNEIAKYIQDMGYDGVKYPSDKRYEGEGSNNYVIYNQKAIKRVKKIVKDYFLVDVNNNYKDVPRVPSGHKGGGQWTKNFTSDVLLNDFLNELNLKNPVQRNPLRPQEFIYGDKANLEFNRFDKGDRKEITLQDIAVFDKSQGIGNSVMRDITDTADKLGITLTLDAKPFGNDPKALDKKSLVEFYKKHGFIIDLPNAYGGEFKTEAALMKYVMKYESESVPMYRKPKAISGISDDWEGDFDGHSSAAKKAWETMRKNKQLALEQLAPKKNI